MILQRTVHMVVPDGVEDPSRPSGGNTYDRRLRESLPGAGWSVQLRPVGGTWPCADSDSHRALDQLLAALPDGSVVLVDGLVASAAPEALVPASRRLRLVVLVHMPLGQAGAHDEVLGRERAVMGAAAAVVTTSDWSSRWLRGTYGVHASRVHVVQPGVDPAPPAAGTSTGERLLCVGAVVPGKGHDVLVGALARLAEQAPALAWRCECVGALDLAPAFVAQVREEVRAVGLVDRVVLTGPRTGHQLDSAYAAADVLVLASRGETYGMVVTEALARAIPVVVTDVGGVPEALGALADGSRPGLLVPADDAGALADALCRWLCEADLRRDLRAVAGRRRASLTDWAQTALRVARVLDEVAA
ncbi:MAG TPA: glycosyltransferase family 4 protein [Nocardioidaceae bacterium]|nr:glycosyltransferase family 4 protein [Nocardioidaceae bacterium]